MVLNVERFIYYSEPIATMLGCAHTQEKRTPFYLKKQRELNISVMIVDKIINVSAIKGWRCSK